LRADNGLNPRPFEYHEPRTLEEAVNLARRYEGEAKFLAGGQSLLPLMKLRILSPPHIIDLNGLKGLDYIRKEGGTLAIGAMTRTADIESSEVLRRDCPILTDCASQIADPLVRNRATIGGNVSHADPANDMPAVMLASGAEMVVVGPSGERKVKASDFFLDAFTTAMQPNELLKELRLPLARTKASAYAKLERQAGDYGIMGVATTLRLSPDGKCAECGIALTGAGSGVIKAGKAERAVAGTSVDARTISKAGEAAAGESNPVGDLRGTSEYKKEMVKVMTKRALTLALTRAKKRRER
jgi:aerobic carbon-monoxide dehydrogenase medium subunit